MKINYSLYIHLFVLSVYCLSLPFTQALTINLGFPLKISEVTILFLILYWILSLKKKINLTISKTKLLLVLFVLGAFISTFYNINTSPVGGQSHSYVPRFGYKVDSILKFFYLIISVFSFFLMTLLLKKYPKIISLFLYGAVISSIISWYLFLGSYFFGDNLILLPGMDKESIQQGGVLGRRVIRCGTFLEGNYMGLFLIVSSVIAFYKKKTKMAYFFIFSLVCTLSTISFLSILLFLFIREILRLIKGKLHWKNVLGAIVVLFSLFLVLIFNSELRKTIISKTINNTSEHQHVSKKHRIDLIETAFSMGVDNFWLGVGINNYAKNFKHYASVNVDKELTDSKNKLIPNNVYAEVFSELGGVNFIIFLLFLFSLYNKTDSYELKAGLVSLAFSFNAFPSYTLLFLWFFFSLIEASEK